MGDNDSDLRLRVVKSGPRGELEVVMKRWGQIQDLSCRQRQYVLMPKCTEHSKSIFKRGFSSKMLTNLGASRGEAGGGGGWQLQLTRTQTLVAATLGSLLPAQPYDVFKNLVWLVPFMFFKNFFDKHFFSS